MSYNMHNMADLPPHGSPLPVGRLKMPSQNPPSATVKGKLVDIKRSYRRPEEPRRKLTDRSHPLTLNIRAHLRATFNTYKL
jgi:hypothetical protein